MISNDRNTPRTGAQDAPVRNFSLPNGLRVVHQYDPRTAMVALDVLYDTGSRDENPSLTGMAHLFEHLMFGGSANVPDFDNVLQTAGGNSNAWTSSDFTNFYDTLPAHNAETAFYLESDRMLALDFSDRPLSVQRAVVIEEFKERVLNQPYGEVNHLILEMMYGEHPYSWPTIGKEPAHIDKVTLEDVRRWFFDHYAPNNAILSVCGNISFERTRELAMKWFGSIPSRDIKERPSQKFTPPVRSVRRELESPRAPQTMIVKAWPMDRYGTDAYVGADMITDLLSAGAASRFFRRLMMGPDSGVFAMVDASITGTEDCGMLMVNAVLADESIAVEDAEKLIDKEIRRLWAPENQGGVTTAELTRTVNRFETTSRLERLKYLGRAIANAQDFFHGETLASQLRQRRAFTPEDIARLSREIFTAPGITLVLRPEGTKQLPVK